MNNKKLKRANELKQMLDTCDDSLVLLSQMKAQAGNKPQKVDGRYVVPQLATIGFKNMTVRFNPDLLDKIIPIIEAAIEVDQEKAQVEFDLL